MSEEEETEEEKRPKEKNEHQEDLDFCRSAPSAEHARASDEDEPCDDGRKGG